MSESVEEMEWSWDVKLFRDQWVRGDRERGREMKSMCEQIWQTDSVDVSTWDWGGGSHNQVAERISGVTVVSCPAQVTHTLQLITAHLKWRGKHS